MLRWMRGVTKKDQVRHEHVGGSVKNCTSDKEDHREKAKVVRTC